MKILMIKVTILILIISGCSNMSSSESITRADLDKKNYAIATLAGGCFWCMETPFENLDGIAAVISGYTGGDKKNPTYNEVASGSTKHVEAVQVYFDPKKISYSEIIDIYWQQFDPTDAGGSFYDRGYQYSSAIFYHNENQKKIAEKSKDHLERNGKFDSPIVTRIEQYKTFYDAEEYHQDFYLKDPNRYKSYRKGSGRDAFIASNWIEYQRSISKDEEELKKKLSEMQYFVTQENGTEPAFDNKYWDNKEKGIYVDIVSGEILFSSVDKFRSGTGWPSFTKPVDARNLQKLADTKYGMNRIEVRSKLGDSHLGHVFYDGPEPTNLRYCINSAALKFIAFTDLEKEGYGNYKYLFK